MTDHPHNDDFAAHFGPYRLIWSKRLLERADEPVGLGSRALDILIALTRRAGEVVANRELTALVWPDTIVDDSSIRVQVAGLRKALGDGQNGARYIANVPGRGYCFVGEITFERDPAESVSVPPPHVVEANLPPPLTRMIGRDGSVRQIAEQVLRHRFVTIVGPGGMGKTTVAVAAAHALAGAFSDVVHFIDLGSLTDPKLVPAAVAAALRLQLQTQDARAGLLAYLREARLLLILDNCEHIVDAAAALAEDIFRTGAHVHLLATSRETLRVEGEHVYWLPPLESPPPESTFTAEEVARFPAVQLFLDRANASGRPVEIDDAQAAMVASICARLDGVALAIELAASRVGAYGLQGTSELLDNRFRLQWQGRRHALARHQTLSALLDWSYNLLPESERSVLRHLSVMVGPFGLDAVVALVALHGQLDAEANAIEAIDALVGKSLVSTDLSLTGPRRYRLLETTRAYASERLAEHGESSEASRRHACYVTARLTKDLAARRVFARAEAGPKLNQLLANARAALEWCFGSDGDSDLGIELTAAAVPALLDMSLMSECRLWCMRALAALRDAHRGSRCEMDLHEAVALSSMFMAGRTGDVRDSFVRALELAEELDDAPHQLRLFAGQNLFLTRVGDCHAGFDAAQRGHIVAGALGEPIGLMVAESMLGTSHSLAGAPAKAQALFESAFSRPIGDDRELNFISYAQRVRAKVHLARALWVQGFADRAKAISTEVLDDATSRDHPVTICICLVHVTSVFMWCGEWTLAEDAIERLVARAERHALAPFSAVGLGFRGELLVRKGHPLAGVSLLRAGLQAMAAEHHNIMASVLATALAEGLSAIGQDSDAIEIVEKAIARADETGEAFDRPEVLRIKAGLLFAAGGRDDEAETALEQSLTEARSQGAMGWELRGALTLARRRRRQGLLREARLALAPIYSEFHEGFDTMDLRACRDFLGQLS